MARWRAKILISMVLAAATLLSFAPVLGNDFVNLDDAHYITHNAHVQAGLTRANAAWALTATEASNWHPLTWWSLQLDRELFGPGAWGFHFTNLVLHAANVVLLFLLLQRMTGALWCSAVVAALFAVHPLHVESVAWAAERKDVLSTFFGLLTLAAYVGYVKHPGWVRYALILPAFALGLLAKPMLVTLPFVLLLLDYWPLGRWQSKSTEGMSAVRLVAEKLPLFVLAGASSAATLWAQRAGHAVIPLTEYPLADRLQNAIVAYARYLGMTVWPTQLSVFYPQPRAGFSVGEVVGAGLLLAGTSLLVLRSTGRRPFLLTGWLWYLGTLVPVIGVVQVGKQALADRYTYIPLIGIFVMLAFALPEIVAARRWARPVVACAMMLSLLGLVACTREQVRTWHDATTLWGHALALDKDNYFAHYNLGIILHEQGKLDDARRHLREALDLYPEFTPTQFKLGVVAAQSGRFDEAVHYLSRVVRESPEIALAHSQLGMALAKQGNLQEGIEQLREALQLDAEDADTHNNLGLALGMQNKSVESVRHFEEAIKLEPKHAEAHYNLALTLERTGQRRAALTRFQEAVRLRPRAINFRARLAQALYEEGQIEAARAEYREIARLDPGWLDSTRRTAWMLATHPNPQVRNGAQALQLAKLIGQAAGEDRLDSLDTLAAAEAEAGQFDLAVATARMALTRAQTAKESADVIEKLQARLQLYEARQPFCDLKGEGPAREVR